MLLAESYDYYLIGPKFFAFVLFVIAGFKIYNLNRKYALNKYYLAGMLSWGIYILMDALIWVISDLSATGYEVGSLMRDLQMFSAMGLGFFIYNAQKIIDKGEKSLYTKRYYVELAVFIVLSILLVYIDGVRVYTSDGVIVNKESLPLENVQTYTVPIITEWTAILTAFPIVVYAYSIYKQFQLAKSKITEKKLKQRIKKRAVGLILILVGIIYFILQNIVGWSGWAAVLTGYAFWIIAPVLIYQSTKRRP